RRSVAHRQVGEELAVDLDVGALEARDERAVREPVDASRGVDARDPQPAEIALAIAPVLVGEVARALQGLERGLEEFPPPGIVALGGLEHLAAASPTRDGGLCAWHARVPPARPRILPVLTELCGPSFGVVVA